MGAGGPCMSALTARCSSLGRSQSAVDTRQESVSSTAVLRLLSMDHPKLRRSRGTSLLSLPLRASSEPQQL